MEGWTFVVRFTILVGALLIGDRFDNLQRSGSAGHFLSNGSNPNGNSLKTPEKQFTWLIVLAMIIAALTAYISGLSRKFELDLPSVDRPILSVLVAFGVAFVAYLAAVAIAKQFEDSAKLTYTVVGFAVLFRVFMLVSTPVQEVDIYRYIWDGVVVSEGISPFRYAPDTIRQANPADVTLEPDLKRLVRRYRRNQGDSLALQLVHFGHVPTVYPPVSQAVFGLAATISYEDASLLTRLRIMKGLLLLFDIGTILVLIQLLKLVNMPTGLSVAYAWCPLVLKEIGNSGHLDSIAIFLTTAAVWLFVRNIPGRDDDESRTASTSLFSVSNLLPVVFLSLAIGAKLYAIVLAPLFVFVAIRRLGFAAVVAPALAFVVTTTLVFWPMLPSSLFESSPDPEEVQTTQLAEQEVDPSEGVEIFLKYWEMNDFLFMGVVENLKPRTLPSRKNVWFSVFPEDIREDLGNYVQNRFETDAAITPFLTTRFLLSVLFLVVALNVALWAAFRNQSADFCRAAFLTIAWFWLLSPTQNPWYWLWALPLIPFIKNRTWYLMSGVLFLYYMRFWFEYHFTGQSVVGSLAENWSILTPFAHYQGVDFFDFVVTWVEYGPWFLLLLLETVSSFRNGKSAESED